jgi:hypothetical protein
MGKRRNIIATVNQNTFIGASVLKPRLPVNLGAFGEPPAPPTAPLVPPLFQQPPPPFQPQQLPPTAPLWPPQQPPPPAGFPQPFELPTVPPGYQGLRMNIESIERFAKEGTAAGAKQSLAFDGYLGGF